MIQVYILRNNISANL